MQTEIEAKFLDQDHRKIRKLLIRCGAELLQPMRLMKRKNFDFPSGKLEKMAGWVRVRDEGDQITLSYKQLNDRSLHGTQEINLNIDNFEVACKFLEALGLEQKSYQETKRESWILEGASIELDEWPWIKPFIEIEASNEKLLNAVINKLGLSLKYAVYGSVENAYEAEFDVTDSEVDHISEITFSEIPGWLAERRKV